MNYYIKLLILFTFFIVSYANARDIYVAKNGDDSNPGTLESPYLTISKAADVAVAGDIVYIREGTYEESLTPLNSGSPGSPIIFQSYPGERVIISAMESLSGWTQDSGLIYKTTVPFASLGQENFVMHRETALDLARWPNKTEEDPFALGTIRNTGGSGPDVISGAYLAESTIPGIDWTGGTIWFYGDRPGSGWLAWKRTITSSTSGRVNFNLTTANNLDWIRTFHPPSDLGDFYLEGVKGALDFKNEWYYNSTTDELFVQIPGGGAPQDGDVKMRRRKQTINLKHKKYIEIRNLAVFGGVISLEDDTRWTTNSNTTNNVLYGISSFYGGHTLGVVTGFSTGVASVNVEGSNNIIERCEIAFGAASGLRVRGNNHEIKECRIHDFDYLGMYDAPVVVRGINNTKFINNTVFNGGRDGINYNGSDNEIGFNDISKSNLIADDCALFYTVGRQPNTEIHHNWFHDAASSGAKTKAAGIYLDNDAASFSVHHNVVWNTEWSSIQINWNGEDIDIFNNTLWNGSQVMGAWHLDGTAFSNVKVWNNLGSDNNWEPQSDKQNNLVVTSSVFENSDNGDFGLKEGSSPIDQGRVITGITDGFVGDNPDIGAYEFGGDNWVAGISWNHKYGPAGLGCYGLPGEDCINLPANDADQDGVGDEHDLCPDTPAGTTVDAEGCPVFTLPSDNFSILVKGETCRNMNNGSISITAKENLSYTVKIEEASTEKDFTTDTIFEGLPAGNYTICITTTADADYKQCFTVTLVEPEDLAVKSAVVFSTKKVVLNLKGSDLYRIELNNEVTVTDLNEITLDLQDGINTLLIKTNKDCQGTHEEKITIGNNILFYPNPVINDLNILAVNFADKEITYQLFSITGQLLQQKTMKVTNNNIRIDMSKMKEGIYFVNIKSSNFNMQSKIIKQ